MHNYKATRVTSASIDSLCYLLVTRSRFSGAYLSLAPTIRLATGHENVEHWKYDPTSAPLSYGIAGTCVREEAREE
jgi:hypothetical protein